MRKYDADLFLKMIKVMLYMELVSRNQRSADSYEILRVHPD